MTLRAQIRLTSDIVNEADAIAARNRWSRSAALRYLIEMGNKNERVS